MTDRFETPTDAVCASHDAVDDAPVNSADIDDLIAHLRAAHDAGATIGELHARLAPLLTGTPTGGPPSEPSSTMDALPFPLPPSNPATEEIALNQPRSPNPGSEVWQSPARRSSHHTEAPCDQDGLPPRGASRNFH